MDYSLQPLVKPPFWVRYRLQLIIAGLVVVLGIGITSWYFATAPKQTTNNAVTTTKKKADQPIVSPSLVNGVMVDPGVANRHPVAVMIENSPDARPQTGLVNADVVYEAVTEGGITRFMGIFSQDYPAKAGPVRSARSYFIDWLSDYDAFYAHAGGSPTAIARISQFGIKDYPHNNDSYHREPRAGVASEHTLFVDVSKIYKFGMEKKGWPATFDTKPWLFKDPTATPTDSGPLTINFSSGSFKVVWKFDKIANEYSRELAGLAHKDALTGAQIKAKTIIVINVSHSSNPAYKGTGKESEWNMSTIGTGAASVFVDGTQVKGTWKKPSRTDRLRFYDEAGKEIELNRGKIWIEVVPQEGSYSVAAAPTS